MNILIYIKHELRLAPTVYFIIDWSIILHHIISYICSRWHHTVPDFAILFMRSCLLYVVRVASHDYKI